MNRDEVVQEVAKITWWHTIDLGQGIVTPGADNSLYKLKYLGIPDDLQGKTVLDIGASDGFFSFEAERRGARRVLAVDIWTGEQWGMQPNTGFELARRVLRSRVEGLRAHVLDLSPEKIGVFDVVFFLGVLYHMRHPLLALERVYSVTGDLLVLETHFEHIGGTRPAIVFYPDSELNGDPSNWWGPNVSAVESMLKDVGFRKVFKYGEYPPRERTFRKKLKSRLPLIGQRDVTRVVFHAWK